MCNYGQSAKDRNRAIRETYILNTVWHNGNVESHYI